MSERTLQQIADDLENLEHAHQGAGEYIRLLVPVFVAQAELAEAICCGTGRPHQLRDEMVGQAFAFRFSADQLGRFYRQRKAELEQELEQRRAELDKDGRNAGGSGEQPGAELDPSEDDEEYIPGGRW